MFLKFHSAVRMLKDKWKASVWSIILHSWVCDSTGPTGMTDCDLLDLNAQVCAGACNYCGDVSVEYGLKRAFDARNYPESCSGKVGGHVPNFIAKNLESKLIFCWHSFLQSIRLLARSFFLTSSKFPELDILSLDTEKHSFKKIEIEVQSHTVVEWDYYQSFLALWLNCGDFVSTKIQKKMKKWSFFILIW